MNALTIPGGAAATMSSREIAELTGKEHRHVLRDIEKMLVELKEDPKGYAQTWTHPQNGQIYPEFLLDRELTETLLTGYSAVLRRKVIARWRELEEQARNPIAALSRVELLKLALDSEEQRAALEHKVEVLEPKAKALDRIADADGTMNPTVAAKALQIQPKRLFDWMREQHWIYRRPGGSGNVAYQDKIQVGYLTHKVTTVQREDGTDKVCEQVLVTAKGLAKLSQAFDAGMH